MVGILVSFGTPIFRGYVSFREVLRARFFHQKRGVGDANQTQRFAQIARFFGGINMPDIQVFSPQKM